MDIQHYLDSRKDIQRAFIQYIDQEENIEEDYQNLINLINQQNIQENQYELKEILNLFAKIVKNHHRNNTFFYKIEKILLYLKDSIKQYFVNSDIFNIFKSNKRILLFLLKKEIIVPNEYIIHTITQEKYKKSNYLRYFYPEFSNHNLFKKTKIIEDYETFNKKREIGENEDHICELIRKDSIDEFISYVNQNDINLGRKINKSIFETNSFLIDKQPTFIEYAAFFGSIQIFRYLYLNYYEDESKFRETIWIYAIHGENQEVINYLEEKSIKPENDSFHKCILESIKCHHNDMTIYIINNFYPNQPAFIEKNDYYFQCFKYNNFEFLPNNLNIKLFFYTICKYDYPFLLETILKIKNLDFGLIAILNKNL